MINIEKCRNALDKFINDKWCLSVPPEDNDPDILISNALDFIEKLQSRVMLDIIHERERQDLKWGEQNHLPQFWTGILGEEFGELCEAINETVFDNGTDKGGYENMKKEAIHVAAVAVGFLECLERNKGIWFKKE